jgi:hypothetical protein
VLPITDHFYEPGFMLNERAQHSTTGPPLPDNILVNGTHKSASGTGAYAKMTVEKVNLYIDYSLVQELTILSGQEVPRQID